MPHLGRIFIGALLAASAVGCDSKPDIVPVTSIGPTAVLLGTVTSPLAIAASPPAMVGTATAFLAVLPAVSLTPVQVTTTGNLFVRRGPDLAFDPISVLPSGARVGPTGRDVLARWLRIPLPGDPSRSGWISIMSEFTVVNGDVASLPEVAPAEWPRLAFVRNCTLHEMLIEPGRIVIPGIQNFPANDVRVNPGTYIVFDMDTDDYPEVLNLEIREGSATDIMFDGEGHKKKCPDR